MPDKLNFHRVQNEPMVWNLNPILKIYRYLHNTELKNNLFYMCIYKKDHVDFFFFSYKSYF